jgi:hypothetical protein
LDASTQGAIHQAEGATLTSVADIWLAAGKTLNQNADITTQNRLFLNGSQGVNQRKGATAQGQRVTYTAQSGDVNLSGVTKATEIAKIEAARRIVLDGEIQASRAELKAEDISDTANASLQVESLSLSGGHADLTRGHNNAKAIRLLNLRSADLALAGDLATVWGSTTNNLKVRGEKKVRLRSLDVGGNLDAAAKDDITLEGKVAVSGDAVIKGKNLLQIDQDDSCACTPPSTDAERKIIENAELNVGGNAQLTGENSITLSGNTTTGGNLVLETQGNIKHATGHLDVGGDLEYKLASTSQIDRSESQLDTVKGKTIRSLSSSNGAEEPKAKEPTPEEIRKAEEAKAEEARRAQAEIQRNKEIERKKKIDALPWWLRPFAWLFGL